MDTNGHSGAAAPIRAGLGQPIIDADGHRLEVGQVLSEQLRRAGDDDGPDMGEVLPESAPLAEAPSGVGR
jgi:hypothetical protein